MLRVRNAMLVMVSIGAVIALAGCTDETKGDEQTLKLTESAGETGTFGPIGNATDKSTPPGSGFAFSTPLQDSSQKAVGQLDAICIATQPSQGQDLKGTCTATATVPDGTLALNAGGTIGEEVSGAIVGGTGKYAGATGTFTSVNADNGGSDDTFNITLP